MEKLHYHIYCLSVAVIFLLLRPTTAQATWNYSPKAATGNISLSVLALVPFTGSEPQNGQTCAAAMKFVADIVNARNDILFKYKIELVLKDETANSNFAARALVEYYLSAFEGNSTATSLSPRISVGPQSSGGGVPYAQVLTPLKMVGISTGCMAARFAANRKSYPNFYRTEPSSELSVFARIRAIKSLTKWKSIAVLTATRPLDFDTANRFFKNGPDSGITVKWFDTIDSITTDETLISLGKSGLRVIVLDFGLWWYAVDFLCAALKFGITGSRYSFIAMSGAFIDPALLPSTGIANRGCTREDVIEQMKYTIYIGSMSFWTENNGPTSLGYDYDEFEVLFDQYTNGTTKKSGDYHRRHACHDYMLQALLTLDSADKLLAMQNKSFADTVSFPDEVFDAVNKSAAAIDFAGLRYGRLNYSSRLEMDGEPLVVVTYSPTNRSFQYNYKLYAGSNISNPNSYQMKMLRPIFWWTADGKPPADQVGRIAIIDDVDNNLLDVMSSFAAAVGLVQIICAIKLALWSRRKGLTSLKGQPFLVCSRFIVIAGCLLLNASAVCFAVGMDGDNAYEASSTLNAALCYLRMALTTLGLSCIHGYVFIRLCFFSQRLHGKTRLVHLTKESSFQFVLPSSSSDLQFDPQLMAKIYPSTACRKHDRLALYFSLVFVAINAVYLLVWFIYDPLNFVLANSAVYHDHDLDAIVSVSVGSCISKNLLIWQLAVAGLHGFLLVSGLYMVYSLRRFSSISAMIPGLKEMQLVQINSLTLFSGAILILLGFFGNPPVQQSVISVLLLISSVATSGLIFGPTLLAVRKESKSSSSSTISQLVSISSIPRTNSY